MQFSIPEVYYSESLRPRRPRSPEKTSGKLGRGKKHPVLLATASSHLSVQRSVLVNGLRTSVEDGRMSRKKAALLTRRFEGIEADIRYFAS